MKRLNVNGMDTMAIGCLAAAVGALPPKLVGISVRIAAQMPDSSVTPSGVELRLSGLGLAVHKEVWPDVWLGSAMPKLTKVCRWALVWMEPDWEHECRWWAVLHTCDSGSPSITVFLTEDPEEAYCAPLTRKWSGHAVVVDSLPEGCYLRQPVPTV